MSILCCFSSKILWIWLKNLEIHPKISRKTVFLIQNQKIQKSAIITSILRKISSKIWCILLKILEIYSNITKNNLRGHWSIVDHPADILPDYNELDFLRFFQFFRFWSWIGNFWVVSISGIRIYFCFLGFTLVP